MGNFVNSKLEVHREVLKAQIFKVRDLAWKQEAQLVREKLASSSPKKWFACVKLLSAPQVKCLPRQQTGMISNLQNCLQIF